MESAQDRARQLAEARQALLERRRKGLAAPGAVAAPPAPRRPADAPSLASFGQERLWYLQQLRPESGAYTMAGAVRLRGHLDAAALAGALQAVVDRHEALRTTLVLDGGALLQRVAPELRVELPEEAVAPGAAEARVRELARAPFDLAQGPLLRAALLREGPESAVFAVAMHHSISDEWSLGVFWRDLAAAYAALARGEAPALAPPPLQYADFAWHQRRQLAEGAFAPQLARWCELLAGDLPVLQLPADRPRPPVQRFEGGFVTRELPAGLAGRLADLSRAAGATPFATLLAAFQLLLHRLSRQSDILVGTPVTNRDRAEYEGVIGFFLNTVVLRADFAAPRSFRELLEATRRQAVAALANQSLPFDRLVEELRPRRDPSHSPLFQAMFVYQEAAAHTPALPGLAAEPLVIDAGVAKFDLTLFAAPAGDGLRLALEYGAALFERATAERLLRCFEVLLESAAANPDAPVAELEILPPEQRPLLLGEWAGSLGEGGDDRCIHDLIAAQPPAARAVIFGAAHLSYGELNARASRLAHHLRELGVGPGVVVGLCAERSAELPVGILGILKAGGAYVPIDPAYPRERVAYILADAGVAVLLTQRHLAASLPAGAFRTVALDDPAIAARPADEPAPLAGPDDLAYLIYTSGSTGTPKGVRVTHRNLVHSTTVRFGYFPEPARCFLLLSSFAFDSSLVGIFWTLCQGGALCLPPHHGERDVLGLAALIERHGVTHTLMLPSLYRLLLDFARPAQLRSLSTVIVAGEPCPTPLAARHHALLPGAALYNEYGPTEGTVWATAWRIPPAPERMLIGRPIPGALAYILDGAMRPVPIGVAGELYIGGRGVAEGYHNRPELTAERFVASPFGPGRLYRTGDLARHLDDGTIEFLGRVDTQVKLSGYRLELSEVEETLARHPAVSEAVALLVDAAPSDADDEASLLRLLLAHPDGARLLAEVEAMSDAAAAAILRELAGEG
jgi:amino acid adenylation domain-containing protein